jgi:hypothetical protein
MWGRSGGRGSGSHGRRQTRTQFKSMRGIPTYNMYILWTVRCLYIDETFTVCMVPDCFVPGSWVTNLCSSWSTKRKDYRFSNQHNAAFMAPHITVTTQYKATLYNTDRPASTHATDTLHGERLIETTCCNKAHVKLLASAAQQITWHLHISTCVYLATYRMKRADISRVKPLSVWL